MKSSDMAIPNAAPRPRAGSAELFLQGAANFRSDHVDLFDGVLIDLVPHTEIAARADLAERLSLLANAPRGLVGQLAREDEICDRGAAAAPIACHRRRRADRNRRVKGQGHLLAMSERPTLSPDLTDVIVRRGDREVVRRAAGNAGALFSHAGYSALIKRAGQDGVLTLTVGQRDDLSAPQLKELLAGSIDIVRRRLFDVVKPGGRPRSSRRCSEISGVGRARSRAAATSRRRSARSWRCIRPASSTKPHCSALPRAYKYEESIAALSAMSAVKIATLDRLIAGDRHDPILIVGKTIGLEWATVRALILLRLGPNRIAAPADIETARVNFTRLMPSTAERVVELLADPPISC